MRIETQLFPSPPRFLVSSPPSFVGPPLELRWPFVGPWLYFLWTVWGSLGDDLLGPQRPPEPDDDDVLQAGMGDV